MILLDDTRALRIVVAGIVTCMAIVMFVATIVQAFFVSPGSELRADAQGAIVSASSTVSLKSSSSAVPTSEHPARLEIPSLAIDTRVQKVGLSVAGNMANPDNFTDVGWYRDGVVPGQPGSAVMAGHVDNGLALAGVFKKLDIISPGADIYVVTESGKRLRFKVRDISEYGYKSAPVEDIFGRTGRPVLRLITCSGKWVGEDQTYDKRIVVTAELD